MGEFELMDVDSVYSSQLPFSYFLVDEYDVTTFEQPLAVKLGGDGYKIYINEKYYMENKKIINDLMAFIAENTQQLFFYVNDSLLINDDLLLAISRNPSIMYLYLGSEKQPYKLKKGDYEILRQSDSLEEIITDDVCEDLEDNFDSLITYNANRELLGGNTYSKLSRYTKFALTKSINSEELKNIIYVNKNIEDVFFEYDDYDNIFSVINYFREYFPTLKFTINVRDKERFYKYVLDNIELLLNSQIYLSVAGYFSDAISLSDFMNYERRLYDFVQPAVNLSPFEKYLFVYNLVKTFKAYKENEDYPGASRNIYEILDNEYMVCVGYAHLLQNLLRRLGIESYDITVDVEGGLDNVKDDVTILPERVVDKKTGEEKVVEPEAVGHARAQIHLVDEKYGIDGYFFADPTWDNYLEQDFYLFSLMSNNEYNGIRRYNYIRIDRIDELFFVVDIEEFYRKLTFLINRNKDKSIDSYIFDFMKCFQNLDLQFFLYLINKYDGLKEKFELNHKLQPDEEEGILFDIGEHIVQKTNKLVDGYQFKEAITVLYRDIYGITDEEALAVKVNEIMSMNKEAYSRKFPRRIKSDRNDNETIVMNEYNKFDIEEQPNLRI